MCDFKIIVDVIFRYIWRDEHLLLRLGYVHATNRYTENGKWLIMGY